MSLTGRAIKYLQEKFPNASFIKDIILKDDGDGPYIAYWGVGEKPSEESLNQEAENAPISEKKEYTDRELLIMIYNDGKNRTTTFMDTMDKINGVK